MKVDPSKMELGNPKEFICPFTMQRQREMTLSEPRNGFSPDLEYVVIIILDVLDSRTVRNIFPLATNLSLWCFVLVA
jgi:hypothetical protein